MTRAQDLHAKANHFADRAAHAHARTARNTYLSLEQSYRGLAIQQEHVDIADQDLPAAARPVKSSRPL